MKTRIWFMMCQMKKASSRQYVSRLEEGKDGGLDEERKGFQAEGTQQGERWRQMLRCVREEQTLRSRTRGMWDQTVEDQGRPQS